MKDFSFYCGKKVLITGHTGFKGAWLCTALLAAGADLTGYALAPPTEPNLFDLCKLQGKMRSVMGDIRDFERLLSVFKDAAPEIVIHMAAQPIVLESYKNPRGTYETNVMGTVNVLESVRQCETVRSFLNVTTDKVYLNRERREGYREDEPLNGFDPYANSKSCSELVTASYRSSFFRDKGAAISTARSGNVIGGGDFAVNRLIPDCARAAFRNEPIQIRNPDAIRPYQHVLDTLSAYLLIAQRQYEASTYAGSYNIGPDENDCRTSAELAAMFCEAWGGGQYWERVTVDNPHEDNTLRLDCTKIRRILGWRPRWAVKDAIVKTAEWYRAYDEHGDVAAVMERQIFEFSAGNALP